MRWKSWCGGLALLASAVGCTRNCYVTCDDQVAMGYLAATHAELDPKVTASPTIDIVPTPGTVDFPERPARLLSLAEAVAIALEQGTTGNQNILLSQINTATGSPFGIATASDQPVSFTGRGVTGTDSIRVLALDPAIVGTGIEQALSKFDAVWLSAASWQNTDRPIGTALDVFQAGGAGTNAIQQQDANVSTGFVKPLPTGGTAGITFNTAYTLTNLQARVNPSYRPTLQFQFEQPLLQGYGVEINQLRAAHPGTQLLTNAAVPNQAPTPEGILVTRIRFDQQRAEFERNVHGMLLNVEIAYWNLYNSYWQLYSNEQGMRQAYEAWKINYERYRAGRVGIADFAQARGQYELFRGQRLNALGDLLENERQLRALLGMHAEDGTRLVPSDQPTLSPFRPDWNTSVQEALNLRPELYLARQEVKANQLNLVLQENSLLPDLRFAASYDINALGNRLDGPDANNAFRNLASDRFNNWQLQLRMSVPIGFRQAHANVRIAKLQLERSYLTLHDQELKIERFLASQYRRIFTSYELIRIRRAQREAFAEQLRARYQEFQAGRGTLDQLLEAQRFWASALADEYTSIRDYNEALAGYEWAKGTIMQHDNVAISEGGVPSCAQKRAVEHLRERSAAIELRERAVPNAHPGPDALPCPDGACAPSLVSVPKSELPPEALPLPAAKGDPRGGLVGAPPAAGGTPGVMTLPADAAPVAAPARPDTLPGDALPPLGTPAAGRGKTN